MVYMLVMVAVPALYRICTHVYFKSPPKGLYSRVQYKLIFHRLFRTTTQCWTVEISFLFGKV